jgi:hypothetical protein
LCALSRGEQRGRYRKVLQTPVAARVGKATMASMLTAARDRAAGARG